MKLTKDIEKIAQDRFDRGAISLPDLYQIRYLRMDAEVQLLRAKADAGKGK